MAVDLKWSHLGSPWSHLKISNIRKNILVGFMLQTMSIYDDTKPLNSLDFKVKTISFNSRNNCFSFHSKSSVQTNVILLKKKSIQILAMYKKKENNNIYL